MSHKLNISAAFNSLSFGNVSFGVTRELFRRGVECSIFPIGQQVDLSSFDQASAEYKLWLQNGINTALNTYSRKNPTLKIWHISGSHERISDKQFLFTFHELDQLTNVEQNILNNQDGVFVASDFNKLVFEKSGVNNVSTVGLGFDSLHFKVLPKRLIPNDVIGFTLLGKAELRKQSFEVLKIWAEKYGNNSRYFLNVQIYNPFLSPEVNQQLITQALNGKRYHNINILPFVKTSSEFNQILNASDIVLGMSRSESWGLPEFTSVALGKFSVIHNAAGYQTWSNEGNSVLVDPSGMDFPWDNTFFHIGQPFNQGKYFTWSQEDFIAALDKAVEKVTKEKVNTEGLKLQEQFTWSKTVDKILEKVF